MTKHTYKQAPYQDITEEQWQTAQDTMPTTVAWEAFATYEKEDTTTGSQEFACTASGCEVVDFPSSMVATTE